MPTTGHAPLRSATVVSRRRGTLTRRLRGGSDALLTLVLVAYTVVAATLMYAASQAFSAVLLMVPLLLADMLLPPRRVPMFTGFVVAVLLVETVLEFPVGIPAHRWVSVLTVLVMAGALLAVSWRRARLGVAGLRGESMLRDLHARISRHGELPALPPGWLGEVSARSASASSLAGDFLAAHRWRAPTGERLSLALTDVSGKGVAAGTRSLVCSGAFGALLGAVPAQDFLVRANDFLLRQGWEEGFATTVHVEVDLRSGVFELRSAGHPPAVHFQARSGRWQVYEAASGSLLGLIPEATFPAQGGRLDPGDALLLYTDGLVERPGRDITRGIDKLIGEAERLIPRGFSGSARQLVTTLGAPEDDCALVVLQRC